MAIRPFSGAQATVVQQEANAACGGYTRVYYLDTTGWHMGNTSATVHPNAASSAGIAARPTEALRFTVLP